MKTKYIVSIFLLIVSSGLVGQYGPDIDQSVKMTAEVDHQQNTITLNWIVDERATSFDLFRRESKEVDWGQAIATFDTSVNNYIDSNVEVDHLYEYKLFKRTEQDIDGFGYLLSGISVSPKHQSGEIALLITKSTFDKTNAILEEYRSILTRDGWMNRLFIIADSLDSKEVRSRLMSEYAINPFDMCLILGDVPIPLSGNVSPDGHASQGGAWAADTYYGDMQGSWSDSVVNNTISQWPVNNNIPGDGKWDQSFIPADLKVSVGRVDFSNLPNFEDDEYTLLFNYLQKNIDFRTKQKAVRRRAMIHNINPWLGALGQSATRDFSTMVSPDSIMYDDFDKVWEESFLCLYAASSGFHDVLFLVTNSEELSQRPLKAVFTGFFGSRFGNYDYENNILRTALGSGDVLSTCWLGAPSWHYHTMSMGKYLGEASILTQNNSNIYTADSMPRGIHINLLGDPTLQLFPMEAIKEVTLTESLDHVDISWTPTGDAEGYYVYSKRIDDDTFRLLNELPITDLNYKDYCKEFGEEYVYMVRGTKLEVTASGSYYNLSTGALDTISILTERNASAGFDFLVSNDSVYIVNTSINFDTIELCDSYMIEEISSNLFYINNIMHGDTLCLAASNRCSSDTLKKVLLISSTDNVRIDDVLSIFPNPASEYLKIVSKKEITTLRMMTNSGQLMLSITPNEKELSIDVSNMKPGIYHLNLNTNSHAFYKKIVVH